MIESCKFILSNFTENERVKINKELINLVAKHGININRNFSVNGQKYVVIYTEDKIEFWYGNFFDNPDFKLTTYQDFMDKYGKTEQNNQKVIDSNDDRPLSEREKEWAKNQSEPKLLTREDELKQIPGVVNIDPNKFPHRIGWFKEV